ncbi:MAG: IPT/TIG domain-containing protein [Candidatus Marinimicrobia bacterium]|nr:IPT/TIG domain-containing protein [Candidatus Neomarinimicrobiota bacterium]
MKKTLMSLSLILIVVLALTGCYEWPDPIWNPDDTGLPTPTITGVDVTTLMGGIDNITITGTGFGDVKEEVLVYFKKGTTVGRGRTLTATNTQLVVEAPATYSDSLEIWIDRRGCFEYAKDTTNLITINAGIKSLPIISTSPLIKVGINENGDIIVAQGSNQSVISVTVDDSISTIPGVAFSNSLNILSLRTKGTDIYYTLREYLVKYDGALTRFKVNANKENCVDFAFADNNKVYIVGNGFIYSADDVLASSTLALDDTDYNFTKCDFYDGKLYVASTYQGDDTLKTNEKAIMAYPVNTDGTLGTAETIINWTDDFAGSIISNITFDADDRMYVATLTRTPIYVIEPVAGSYADGNISLLYPVLLNDNIISMRWETGDYMAFLAEDNDAMRTVYRLNMLETASASYIP